MKYKLYIIVLLSSFNAFAQQIAPSNNRSIVGLEKNMLFNAKSRFTVTQTGTATLDILTLFDGKMAPSYTNIPPSLSNPTVVVIEDLLNLHIQAGAWIGWTTRYWAPKTFKIEGYNAYDNANTWVTIANVTNYTNFDYIQAVPSGAFTKLRFTFYEGTGTNGLLGISELFFLHPEAVAAYDGLSLQYNSNSNVGVGTVNTTGARLEVKGEFTPAYAQMALVGKNEGSGIGISFNEASLNRRAIIYAQNGNGLVYGDETGYGHRFFSGNSERMFIKSNGNVGIGTSTPTTPLHLVGNFTLQGSSNTNYVSTLFFKRTEGASMYSIGPKNATLTNSNFDINSVNGNPITLSTESIERVAVLNNGNVGIGTSNPTKNLEIGGLRSMIFDSNLGLIKMKADAGGWAMNYGFTGSTGADLGGFWGYGGANELVQWSIGKAYTDNFLVVKSNGQVTIGTATAYSDYKLAVAGNIIADKVKVKKSTNGVWPDFVFAPIYKLPSLTEVESFVKQNSHLPEIPSASEIEKDGQDLGEMNRLLLKKVEELTLYLIEQNKEIKALKSKVELLEKK